MIQRINKIHILIVATILFAVFGSISYAIGPYTIVTGGVLSTSADYNGQRKIARTSNGDLHVVYFRNNASSTKNIYYSKSTDGGINWMETALTAEIYENSYPAIAVDGNDNIFVFWHGKGGVSTSTFQIRYREYTGGSWGDITQLTSGTYTQKYPSVAVDSNNYLHVAWSGYVASSTTKYQLRYEKYTTSWQGIEELTTDFNNEFYYSTIAIGPDDYIHLGFEKFNWTTLNYEIQYLLNDGSWQAREEVASSTDYNRTDHSIAVDSVGNVHVVYKGKASSTANYILYRERTSSWQEETTLWTYTIEQWWPAISIDSSDNLDILWAGDNVDHGDYKQYHHIKYYNSSSSWSGVEYLTDTSILGEGYAIISLWAYQPVIDGARTNRPKTGYSYIYNRGDDPDYAYTIFYDSGDSLDWDTGSGTTTTSVAGNINLQGGRIRLSGGRIKIQ